MSLEAATYINGLVPTNPLSGDARSEGDDHIRLLKATIQATFPNLTGAMTLTQDMLNGLQAQIDSKPPLAIGTVCLFYQANAPTGWTKVTAHNDKALRVVSGSGGVSGGTFAFSSTFIWKGVTGTIGGTAITIAQMPYHTHSSAAHSGVSTTSGGASGTQAALGGSSTGWATGGQGGSQAHDHVFYGNAIDLTVQYIDLILASRTT